MILTVQDEIGWLAWKGWNMQVFGKGETEDEAIADLRRELGDLTYHGPKGGL